MRTAAPHRPAVGLRTAALAVALCALAVGFPPILGSASAQTGTDHVLVGTTGNESELRDRVPIGQFAGQKPRVVMAMGPGGLPSLSSGDKLQVTAELEVTTDCLEKSTRCVGEPYDYNPIVQTRVVLANAPSVAEGVGTLDLGAQRLKCRQHPPDREHHCVIVFADTVLDVADRSQLPCAPESCFLNLVVDAHNPKKKRGERNKLLIGEDEPDGTVGRDKARLNAIRFAPGSQPQVPPQVTNTLLVPFVPVRKGEDVVLFSQELTGLERNDQLAASAVFTVSVGTVPYNVLNRTRVILAPDPTATAPGKDVKQLTEPKGEIAEANGFNCTHRKPLCTTTKVGVITMRRDAEDEAGDPIPLYANVVFDTAKPGSIAPAGDAVQIFPGGGLSVTTYPAAMLG
ncbi:MAG TPA: hypothetical protein VE401_03035 [Solirubrobacterales bacterium]|nr:hypothetical protein [Solirubrobacterales bacterium]